MANEQAIRVANTFVSRYADEGSIAHMKLQKLCYFAYGWWLGIRLADPPLMNARPQIWKLGPVFHPVYSAFAGHRSSILAPTDIKSSNPFEEPSVLPQDGSAESQIVDWIWSKYGGFSGFKLSDMTHEVGTPWFNIAQRNNFSIQRFTEMPDDEVRTYFSNLARAEGVIQ